LSFKSIDSNINEIESGNFSPLESGNFSPLEMVKHNAVNKGRTVAKNFSDEIVISADTIVVLNNLILNKPANESQAFEYLNILSGNMHSVYTGFNIIDTSNGNEIFDYEVTNVYFRKFFPDEINFYIQNYSPLDKAGAYGIQDEFGCLFINKIEGDFYNVVGLPLTKLYLALLNLLCLNKIS